MSNELSTQRVRVICASESTYGTDAVDAILQDGATDIIYQEVASPQIVAARNLIEFDRARGSQSGNKHQSTEDSAAVTGTWAVTGRRGSGSGEEAPYWDPIARAMNLVGTAVASTSYTYAPATVAQQGMTMYQYNRQLESDGYRLIYSTGVRGSGTFEFALDSEVLMSFEGAGQYQGVYSDDAEFFSPATGAIALLKDGTSAVTTRTTGSELYADLNPIICRNMTLTIDGVVFPVTALTWALNWTQAPVRTLNASTGLTKNLLTRPGVGSRIGGSFTLLDGDLGFDKVLDLYENSNEVALNVVATSGDSGSGSDRFTLTANDLQIGVPSQGDSNGLMTHDVPFFLNGDWSNLLTDNDFSLVIDTVP